CLTGAANQISKIIHRRRHPAVANGGNRLEPGPTECSEQWLHDVAAEQAQHLNSLVQIVNGLISDHDLISESPFVELHFLLKIHPCFRCLSLSSMASCYLAITSLTRSQPSLESQSRACCFGVTADLTSGK